MLELHPEDPAALAPLLCTWCGSHRAQGSFQPPRILHSYLEGVGVEVMANSDNVVRAGLTSKPVDLEELLAVVEAAPTARAADDREPPTARGAARYESTVEEFELWRLEARPGTTASMDGRERAGDRDLHAGLGQCRGAGPR